VPVTARWHTPFARKAFNMCVRRLLKALIAIFEPSSSGATKTCRRRRYARSISTRTCRGGAGGTARAFAASGAATFGSRLRSMSSTVVRPLVELRNQVHRYGHQLHHVVGVLNPVAIEVQEDRRQQARGAGEKRQHECQQLALRLGRR